jgi:molybdopterin-guanine dinucleotide biosynthesis protein A
MKNCEELIEKYIKEHEDKVMALAKQTDFKGIETKELKIRI